MFNPSTAIIVIAIGVFAGYFFDGERKNHDMVWLGIFILVFAPLMIGAKYGFNWGIAGLIEVIAGIGLYKMFFHKMFKGGQVAEEQIQDTNVSKIEPSTNEEPKGEYKNGKKHGKEFSKDDSGPIYDEEDGRYYW